MLDLDTVKARIAFPQNAIKYYAHTVFALFCINLCLFWPGLFSLDTLIQWDQVLTGQIGNLHPPIMSIWWRWLNHYIMMDRGVLLLFHLVVYWSAIYIIGRQIAKYSPDWAFCLLLFWVSPSVLSMTSVLWKDSGMAFCFLLASGLMLYATSNKQRLSRLSALVVVVALFYGTAVRYNSFFALPPLCYWLVRAYYPYPMHWFKSCLLALAAMLALIGTTQWFNKQVINEEVYLPQQFMIISLSMASHATNQNMMPEYLLYDHGLTYNEYRNRMFISYRFMDTFRYHTEDPQKLAMLNKAFLKLVTEHPLLFIQQRVQMLYHLLRFDPDKLSYYAFQYPDNPHTKPMALAISYIDYLQKSFWFRPWVWYMLAIVLGFVGVKRLRECKPFGMELVLLNISGVVYVTLTALIAPGTDFRFNYWMILACILSLIMWACTITRDEVLTLAKKCKNIAINYRTWRMQ